MINEEKLKFWCFQNLTFNNNPKDWNDTYIVDILNGYNGTCYATDGKVFTYQQIRNMFKEETEYFTVSIKFNSYPSSMIYYLTHDVFYSNFDISESFQDDCLFDIKELEMVKNYLEKDSVSCDYNYTINLED